MKTKLKIACTLISLSLAGNVLAETMPSSVTGIEATAHGNEITVTWDAVTSDPISYYRVYYSTESILDNAGLFDDFETTEGNETTMTFAAPVGTTELYASVIAVATSGMESEFFIEEAHVEVGDEPMEEQKPVPTPLTNDTPSSEPSSTSTEETNETSMEAIRLLKADVTTPTEIVVTFSGPLTVEGSRAPEGLVVEGPDGQPLPITSITIDGSTITIHTHTQTRGTVYNVQFSEPFVGLDGQALDSADRSALVSGHTDGKEPAAAPAVRTSDPMSPPDIENFIMVPEIQQNGGYTVTMEWTVDNTPGDLYGIVVYQTRDGQTFGPPSLLPIDIGGVQLQNVTPGFFGLYIQTVNMYGYVSPGVFQYANLPQYIPGQGFLGDLTFGSMDSNGEVLFNEVDDADKQSGNDIATIDVITEDSPMNTIDGVDHSAAAEQVHKLNVKNAVILAGGSALIVLMLIGAFVFIPQRKE